jgi:LysM repeat protein
MTLRLLNGALALAIAGSFSSCFSSGVATQIPLGNWETEAALVASSTTTPEHSLSKLEYPFDGEGNYITAWAAGDVQEIDLNTTATTSWATSSTPTPTPSRHPADELAAALARVDAASAPTTAPLPTPVPDPQLSSRYHKVGASDTLWGHSQKYGTTVSAIQRANGLSSTTIRTGSTIKIPG